MKKILVLMLVLGITSMATAGLTLTGPIEVPVGGSIVLSVTADAISAAQAGDYANVYAPGTLASNPTMTANMSGGAFSLINDYLYAPYDYFYMVGANAPGVDALLPGIWVNFDLSAGSLPVGSIIPISITGGGAAHNVTVVIPEPMTIGLLSLGGLFLRRRK